MDKIDQSFPVCVCILETGQWEGLIMRLHPSKILLPCVHVQVRLKQPGCVCVSVCLSVSVPASMQTWFETSKDELNNEMCI